MRRKDSSSTSFTIGIDASRATQHHRTGTETYSLELIKGLTQIQNPHRWRLYTPNPPQHSDWPEQANTETQIIPWPRLWTHIRLAWEIAQNRPDLLFVPAHVLPLYCPVPTVVTIHDLGYYHYPEAHPRFDRWYLDWTTRRHTRFASHIIADSQATKNDLIHLYGAEAERISVIYLGRDESLKPVTDHQFITRAKIRYNIKGEYLLYLGTLQPRKNLIRLIEAFQKAMITVQDQDLTLVIAGKRGWLYDQIFARVQTLGLTDRVHFPGYVADEDKSALLSGALAYVFPSLYEGFGLPVLEAMACGIPVLTSNGSSLPEVAGQAALLVDPHSTDEIATGLVQLITQPDLRQHLIEMGYQQIKKFSWTQTSRHVLEVLEEQLSKFN